MNTNLPNSFPEVPDIDDCDHLFSCTSRNGKESLYARAQEFTFEGKVYYATALTFDGENDCHDLPFPEYAHSLVQVANWLIEQARDQWGKGLFCQCSDTKKTRTIY